MSVCTNNTKARIEIFRRCFSGLPQVYGTYDPATGRARQVKEPVTDQVILNHLSGKQSYGVYLLTGDKTRALAVDFDIDDIGKPVAFVDYACKYEIPAYVERSKSKGYHVWFFFQGAVPAFKARLVTSRILENMGMEAVEVFPKQDALDTNVTYGNYINAPLFGPLVAKGRTVFLNMAEYATPYTDQWTFLENVQRISEEKLNKIITAKKWLSGNNHRETPAPVYNDNTTGQNTSRFGLPPCARRMLAEGVSSYQRVACFRLAINLKRIGMPQDLALIILRAWAGKNQPVNGKRIITDSEIKSQTQYAYSNSYRGLGCELLPISEFCDKDCPIYQNKLTKANLNEQYARQ